MPLQLAGPLLLNTDNLKHMSYSRAILGVRQIGKLSRNDGGEKPCLSCWRGPEGATSPAPVSSRCPSVEDSHVAVTCSLSRPHGCSLVATQRPPFPLNLTASRRLACTATVSEASRWWRTAEGVHQRNGGQGGEGGSTRETSSRGSATEHRGHREGREVLLQPQPRGRPSPSRDMMTASPQTEPSREGHGRRPHWRESSSCC